MECRASDWKYHGYVQLKAPLIMAGKFFQSPKSTKLLVAYRAEKQFLFPMTNIRCVPIGVSGYGPLDALAYLVNSYLGPPKRKSL